MAASHFASLGYAAAAAATAAAVTDTGTSTTPSNTSNSGSPTAVHSGWSGLVWTRWTQTGLSSLSLHIQQQQQRLQQRQSQAQAQAQPRTYIDSTVTATTTATTGSVAEKRRSESVKDFGCTGLGLYGSLCESLLSAEPRTASVATVATSTLSVGVCELESEELVLGGGLAVGEGAVERGSTSDNNNDSSITFSTSTSCIARSSSSNNTTTTTSMGDGGGFSSSYGGTRAVGEYSSSNRDSQQQHEQSLQSPQQQQSHRLHMHSRRASELKLESLGCVYAATLACQALNGENGNSLSSTTKNPATTATTDQQHHQQQQQPQLFKYALPRSLPSLFHSSNTSSSNTSTITTRTSCTIDSTSNTTLPTLGTARGSTLANTMSYAVVAAAAVEQPSDLSPPIPSLGALRSAKAKAKAATDSSGATASSSNTTSGGSGSSGGSGGGGGGVAGSRTSEGEDDGDLEELASVDDFYFEDINKTKFYFYSASLMMSVRVFVYPISLLKTRMQVEDAPNASLRRTAVDVFRNGGVRGFFRGFTTTAVGILPSQACYLTTIEASKQLMVNTENEFLIKYKSFLAGGIASFAVQCLGVPIDVISQRLMVQGDSKATTGQEVYKSGLDAVRKIVKKEGVIGLYRGYFASILTYVPSSALWWATYDNAKKVVAGVVEPAVPVYTESGRRLRDVFAIPMIAGFTSGVTTAILTNPLDVGKTRLQVISQDTLKSASKSARRPTMFSILYNLVKEEGVLALQRGVSARVANMGPSSALMIMTYELVRSLSYEGPA